MDLHSNRSQSLTLHWASEKGGQELPGGGTECSDQTQQTEILCSCWFSEHQIRPGRVWGGEDTGSITGAYKARQGMLYRSPSKGNFPEGESGAQGYF